MSRTMTKPTFAFATSLDPDQPAHSDSMRIHAVHFKNPVTSRKMKVNSAQTGLDACWSKTHYVAIFIARLIFFMPPQHLRCDGI
jgi:hypothetical protein